MLSCMFRCQDTKACRLVDPLPYHKLTRLCNPISNCFHIYQTFQAYIHSICLLMLIGNKSKTLLSRGADSRLSIVRIRKLPCDAMLMQGDEMREEEKRGEGLLEEDVGMPSTLPVPRHGQPQSGTPSNSHPSRLPRMASGMHRAQRTASACTDPQEQQCAEEECDADECGDERKPPADSVDCFGNDKRPYLPLMLFGSTLVGAMHMLMIQFPIIMELAWGYEIRVFFLCVYIMTLYCLMYSVLCDPGKLPVKEMEAFLQTHEAGELPRRCHKMWLFKQPIRRYDHYCRWLTNAVGLLNHREFLIMLAGLLTIGVCGCMVDFVLLIWTSSEGRHFTGFLLIMHLTCPTLV